MKNRVLIFLVIVLFSLLVPPVINIFSASNVNEINWKKKSFLYNMDFFSRICSMGFYYFGISTNSKQVIIGFEDWLYLGDQYEQTISIDRRPPTSSDLEVVEKIGIANSAWNVYLSSKGVKLFRVMIGPNKGAIYPEHMPRWARPASPNFTDALIAATDSKIYVDLRKPLLEAKINNSADLYYKTDTHWNNLGASIAFRAFAQQVSAAAPEIRWPSDSIYQVNNIATRAGGDLANFLRLSGSLPDVESIMQTLDPLVETSRIDFDTKKIMHRGGNPHLEAPKKPLLVESIGALNNKRVLWLRDSFGSAMSPLMSTTFSDVLQLHWNEGIGPKGRLVQLVEEWKPDYVFFTVVERAARTEFFTNSPPPIILPIKGNH